MELLCQPSPRQLAAAAAAGDQGPAVVNRWVAVNSPAAAGVNTSAVKRSIGSTNGCTITEKAPTKAFS